jgi:preprotein translocase subunit SecE
MAVQEEVKRERAQEAEGEPSSIGEARAASEEQAAPDGLDEGTHDIAPVGAASPSQLGTRRFVYAGYFAAAIAVAFLASKLIDFGWLKAQSYRPAIGEPTDEVVMPVSALIGGGTAFYYWTHTRARELADEVATEMSKVTWPSRTEVTNGTFVVIVTTVLSTVFFALMDKFWGFVTNLVYGGS